MDERLFAPATSRNRQPILEVLAPILPTRGTVLEIASGTGEHSVWFAQQLPELLFQPSDPDPRHRRSITAWRLATGCENVLAPLALDVCEDGWEGTPELAEAPCAMVCINLIHISPWEATLGLLRGAAERLEPGRFLFLYGPYREQGAHPAPSNEAFDRSLRRRDPRFGVRDLERVTSEAQSHGFELEQLVRMPSNNLSLVLRKCPPLTDPDGAR